MFRLKGALSQPAGFKDWVIFLPGPGKRAVYPCGAGVDPFQGLIKVLLQFCFKSFTEWKQLFDFYPFFRTAECPKRLTSWCNVGGGSRLQLSQAEQETNKNVRTILSSSSRGQLSQWTRKLHVLQSYYITAIRFTNNCTLWGPTTLGINQGRTGNIWLGAQTQSYGLFMVG